MKKNKKNLGIEVKKVKKTKMLYSRIPVGSILFALDGRFGRVTYEVTEEISSDNLPTYTKCEVINYGIFPHSAVEVFTKTNYERFVSRNSIYSLGFDYCVENNIYKILDTDYIKEVKKIRELKTISDIKKYLESNLRGM